MSEPNEALLSVAAAISDGLGIDWLEVAHAPAAGHDTQVLRELRLLDQIAAFHRSTEPLSPGSVTHGAPADAALSPTDPSTHRAVQAAPADEADEELQSWGNLAILGKIGEGAFGAVYRARDSKLQREVALKLLWPGGASADPTGALKEARLLARVRHPNVATVYGADHIGGRVGLWMELVKGRTLAELLRTHGPFGAREAALVGLDLCRALAAVHGAGLLHGDIKAHNVMREEGGRTVLMDFGTGKDLNLDRRDHRGGNDFAGTPLYLAPEVFVGQPRTKATDIYSLGVLLYHLVTGSYPVEGRTRDDVQAAHRRQERHHLRDVRPDLPEEFVQAVQRALDPDPRQRFQSAGAFESALARMLGATPEIEHGWLTAHMRRIALAAAAVAILLTAGGVYLAMGRRSPPAPAAIAAAVPVTSPQPAAVDLAPSYTIETALYREVDGKKIRLRVGSRVEPGDNLFAELRSSVPTYVYIVNEDEHGGSYMLFPLPGQSLSNPLPAGRTHRLPGKQKEGTLKDQELSWVIDQAGGHEHFTIFASPTRLEVLEHAFAGLPRPEIGKPILSARLPPETVGALRSVGGLAAAPAANRPATGPLKETTGALALGDSEETARGPWIRQLTLDNPAR